MVTRRMHPVKLDGKPPCKVAATGKAVALGVPHHPSGRQHLSSGAPKRIGARALAGRQGLLAPGVAAALTEAQRPEVSGQ
jgi:hypothetical protein